jgi:stage II sporulation protein D (peptidoglycan lytic transglycosylase)
MHAFARRRDIVQLIVGVAALACLATSIVLIIERVFEPAPVAAPTVEPQILVRLARGADVLELAGPALVFVGPLDGPGMSIQTPASILHDETGWYVDSAGVAGSPIGVPDATIEVRSVDGSRIRLAPDLLVTSSMRLRPRSDLGPTQFDAIGSLGLERYVAGVVGAETYAGWGAEALKAQAVAARSYAICERTGARAKRRPFDIDIGQAAQALELEPRPDASVAADATRGVVLTSQGHVLRAYYSSTCGGRAASASDNWEGPENEDPPIQAHARDADCASSPLFRWSVERPTATLSARLAAWGREHRHQIAELGVITSIEVVERNDAGRPTRFVVHDNRGRGFRIAAESLRLACNEPIGDDRPEQRVRSNDVEFSVDGPRVTIEGRGFGHGVGLCQFGAAELAERGELWPAILSIYYPGAQLQRAYE